MLLVVITLHGLWSVSLTTPDAEKKTLLPLMVEESIEKLGDAKIVDAITAATVVEEVAPEQQRRRPAAAAVDVTTDSSSTTHVEDKATNVIKNITPEKHNSPSPSSLSYNGEAAPLEESTTTDNNDRDALQENNQVAIIQKSSTTTTMGEEEQKDPITENNRTAFPTLANLTAKPLHEIISTDTAAMEYPTFVSMEAPTFIFESTQPRRLSWVS